MSYITELEEKVIHYTDRDRLTPHPSIVLYKGSTVIVGNEAKSQINLDGDESNTIPPVIGREDITREMVVSEVLKYLKNDCDSRNIKLEKKLNLDEAVFTIPVSFNGKAREELRQAAK